MDDIWIVMHYLARRARMDLMRLLSNVDCKILDLNIFNFRIKVNNTRSRVEYISCSLPPDVNSGGGGVTVFETAIVDANGNLFYDDKLEYEDVRRFTTIEEVADEVKRICSFVE
jgi:hypothetical protein